MRVRAAVLIATGISLPAVADTCYPVDAGQGSVSYEVRQAGSPFRGKFRRFGGEVCFESERVTRIDVWLDPASVDSGMSEIDEALKDKEFFAVSEYGRVTYASQSVEARGDSQVARGELAMKGRHRPLDVPFKVQRDGKNQIVSGTLTLNRLDSGVGTGEWSNTQWLGGEVKVQFRAMLLPLK